ncbi:hypothetical protein BH10BAC2_BH10BAC2_17330 [soil metagenome]
MKLCEIIFTLYFTFVITGCSNNKTVEPVNQNSGLIDLALILNQQSPPGLTGDLGSIDDVTSKGINLFGMSFEWQELETSPYIYSFQDQIVNPLTFTDPGKTKFKSYILVLKVIDTQRKTIPTNLAALSFNDPLVISRFESLIDSLSALPSIDRISHILIGNEVDGYLSVNPTQLNTFSTFYKQVLDYIHTKCRV